MSTPTIHLSQRWTLWIWPSDTPSTSLYSPRGTRIVRLFGWDTDWRGAPARWHALLVVVCADHHQATTDNAASGKVWSSDHQQMPFLVRCAYILDLCCDSDLFADQAHMDVFLRRRYTYFSLALLLLLHPMCCNYSTDLFIMVLILMMILMVRAYFSIVNPPARITSSCIWRVTTSTTGRRLAPEQRYSPVSI